MATSYDLAGKGGADIDSLVRRTSDVKNTLQSVTSLAQQMMQDARTSPASGRPEGAASTVAADPRSGREKLLPAVPAPQTMMDQLSRQREGIQQGLSDMTSNMAARPKDLSTTGVSPEEGRASSDGGRVTRDHPQAKLKLHKKDPPRLGSRGRDKSSQARKQEVTSSSVVQEVTSSSVVQEVTSSSVGQEVTSSPVEQEVATPPWPGDQLEVDSSPYVATFFGGNDSTVAMGNTTSSDLWSDDEGLTLVMVFRYLSISDLFRVGGVSRKWREMSRIPSLWREVEFRDIMLTPEILRNMSVWCGETELLKLHGLIPVPAEAGEDLDVYVQRQRGCLEGSLAVFFQCCGHTLRKVYITECHVMVTERVLWLLGIYCPGLVEVAYSSQEFPACAEAVWSLSCGAPELRSLYFPPVPDSAMADRFTDHCLYRMATGFPRLRCAAFGGPSITPSGVAQFVFDCPNLKDLRLVECFEINQSTVKSLVATGNSKVVVVSFINTQVTSRGILVLIKAWKQLKKIHVFLSYLDYFDDLRDQKSIAEFKKIVSRLKELQSDPMLKGRLQVFSQYK